MTTLHINDVLGAVRSMQAPFAGSIRILEFSDDNEDVAVARTDLKTCRAPFVIAMETLETAVLNGAAVPVDASCSLIVSEGQLAGRALDNYERSKRAMIRLLGTVRILGLESDSPDKDEPYAFERLLFDKHYARHAYQEVAKEEGVSKKSVERAFYRYLAYGMTPFAIAGKQKPANGLPKRQKPGTTRRGRKPSFTSDSGSLPSAADARPLVEPMCELFLKGEMSFKAAFHFALRTKYAVKPISQERLEEVHTGWELTWPEIEPFLLPPEKRPTEDVFRYIIKQIKEERGIERPRIPGELRPRKPAKKHRGRARDGVRGPLYQYQIDSTKIQRRLISRLFPFRVISPSTLYLIIDVWSSFIVEFVRSLDHPSFNLGAAAINRCLEDRGERYRALGIPYDPSRYPPPLAPTAILCDRFEFPGPKAKPLRELGIKFAFARPGKGDDKGPVEGAIGKVKHGEAKRRFFFPGEYAKNPGRGDDDGMGDATLDTREHDERLYRQIDAYNDEPVPLKDFPADALAAGLKNLSRRELFLWGLKHRSGGGFSVTEEDRITYLMQAEIATVTPKSINLDNQKYDCPEFDNSNFLKRSGTNKIEARSSNLKDHFIYIRDETVHRWLMAPNQNEQTRLMRYSVQELTQYRTEHKTQSSQLDLKNDINHSIHAAPLNKEAKRKLAEVRAFRRDKPKDDFQGDIRSTTADELELEHAEAAHSEMEKYAAKHGTTNVGEVQAPAPVDTPNESDPRKPVQRASVAELATKLWKEHYGHNGRS